MKKSILLFFFLIITKTSCIFAFENKIIGGWFTYDQQFGALNNRFITFGGINTGISIAGVAIGLGFYGNYPFKEEFTLHTDHWQLLYGGINIGYKKRWNIVGIRSSVLLGGGSVYVNSKVNPMFGIHFVVSPSVYLDIALYKYLVLSFGVTYRYYNGASQRYYININDPKNSFLGNISLGFVY